jgi:hypothetical protein
MTKYYMTYFVSWIIVLGRLQSSGLTQPLKPYSFFCEFPKNFSCIAYQPISKYILLHPWDKEPLICSSMFLWLGTCPVWRKFFVYSINTCINFINYIMYTNCIKFLQHSVVQFFIYPKSINVTITVPSVQKIHLFLLPFSLSFPEMT